jgi:hypothetical protein
MARWWTKPPIVVIALGALIIMVTALLPRISIIKQVTGGENSPAIGTAGGPVTIIQPSGPLSSTGPLPASPPTTPPQAMPVPPGPSWWQQPSVIAAIITAVAAIAVALIPRLFPTPSAEKTSGRKRPTS